LKLLRKNDAYEEIFKETEQYITPITRYLCRLSPKCYFALWATANQLAEKLDGYVVVSLPNGKVVVDTRLGECNTLENFHDDFIGPNQNTNIATMNAQLWPCGVGVETTHKCSKWPTTHCVAVRLGDYLESAGTITVCQPEYCHQD